MSNYYCHNRPLAKNKEYTFVEVQQNEPQWFDNNITCNDPKLVRKTIKTRFSEGECHHITSFNDVDCEGCRHRRVTEDE